MDFMGIFKDKDINRVINGAIKIAIAGHIRPDGDCIGSCMAMYQYLRLYQDELGIEIIDVYLEPIGNTFNVIKCIDDINHTYDKREDYDVFISLDCSSLDRLGYAKKYFVNAAKTINIDHHVSNTSFADINHVSASASSTCEVIYELIHEEKISRHIAESLYIGIIHDTGVFKHSNTTKRTLNIAANLVDKGISFSKIIDDTFFQKTYIQNQLLGRCLMDSFLRLDEKVIITSVNKETLEFYQASPHDTEGVIDQIRVTKGVEVAIFIYETDFNEYKVSLRSNNDVDVSKIAMFFGGGGHVKAAGCTMYGNVHDVIDKLVSHIEKQLVD